MSDPSHSWRKLAQDVQTIVASLIDESIFDNSTSFWRQQVHDVLPFFSPMGATLLEEVDCEADCAKSATSEATTRFPTRFPGGMASGYFLTIS